MDAKLRAWWSARQRLDGSAEGMSAREVLEQTGWARSVAGASPYLALFARAGLRRAAVDAELAKAAIHELPAARGCTYIVPASQYALALTVGQNFSAKTEVATARKLGVTDAEVDKLKTAILKALAKEPLDPDALRTAVGSAARSLGPEGVRKGLATTLPLALGLLQTAGEIRRLPVNGRIDQQRYKYAVWQPNPRAKWKLDTGASFTELAREYYRWIGAASLAEFQWFSGLGVKASQAAVAPLNLVPLQENLLALPEDRAAFEKFQLPKKPHYVLTGTLDNISHLRRAAGSLISPEDADHALTGKAALLDLPSHAILDRGRLIGLWHFDPETDSIAWTSFVKRDRALEEAVKKTEAFVCEDLGDARTFSLDSPKSRVPQIAALRKAAKAS
jgi:hypothetical protein